jgi:hypothetical protein
MQMSQVAVFVFVEGRDPDPYVYGTITSKAVGGFTYEVCRAEQLERIGGGGKVMLLRFFDLLSTRNALAGPFKGKKYFAFFYLDKDVDDLLGSTLSSPHMLYTEYYDVENHIYSEGDLKKGAEAAATIAPNESPPSLAKGLAWRTQAATHWKPWVILSLLVARLGVSCDCGYSLKSRLNPKANAAPTVDPAEFLEAIRMQAGLSEPDFRELVERVTVEVEEHYQRGDFDKVFKGKWYAAILHADILDHIAGKPANRDGLERRLTPAIAQTLDFGAAWSARFLNPLVPLVQRHLLG